jgi:hypothetical protein
VMAIVGLPEQELVGNGRLYNCHREGLKSPSPSKIEPKSRRKPFNSKAPSY